MTNVHGVRIRHGLTLKSMYRNELGVLLRLEPHNGGKSTTKLLYHPIYELIGTDNFYHFIHYM